MPTYDYSSMVNHKRDSSPLYVETTKSRHYQNLQVIDRYRQPDQAKINNYMQNLKASNLDQRYPKPGTSNNGDERRAFTPMGNDKLCYGRDDRSISPKKIRYYPPPQAKKYQSNTKENDYARPSSPFQRQPMKTHFDYQTKPQHVHHRALSPSYQQRMTSPHGRMTSPIQQTPQWNAYST